MAVKIGSARIDERGKISGGAAGDQTGGEVSTQNWYRHSKGWRVFRCKAAAKAEKIALAMERACANKRIGYDQNQRNSLWSNIKGAGYDPAKTTKAVETDCSALVRVCCAYAGIILDDFNTSTEAARLLASGQFVELTDGKFTAQSAYLHRGDILVTKTKGHTVVVLSNGSKAAEEVGVAPEPKPEPPSGNLAVIPGTWNVRSGPGTAYPVVQTVRGGDKLQEVETDWKPVLIDGQVGWISPKAVALLHD